MEHAIILTKMEMTHLDLVAKIHARGLYQGHGRGFIAAELVIHLILVYPSDSVTLAFSFIFVREFYFIFY